MVAVVGRVGAGKTSLLHALLGEMNKVCVFFNRKYKIKMKKAKKSTKRRKKKLKENLNLKFLKNQTLIKRFFNVC